MTKILVLVSGALLILMGCGKFEDTPVPPSDSAGQKPQPLPSVGKIEIGKNLTFVCRGENLEITRVLTAAWDSGRALWVVHLLDMADNGDELLRMNDILGQPNDQTPPVISLHRPPYPVGTLTQSGPHSARFMDSQRSLDCAIQ